MRIASLVVSGHCVCGGSGRLVGALGVVGLRRVVTKSNSPFCAFLITLRFTLDLKLLNSRNVYKLLG